ncbi:hypothetical protein RUMCAL_01025 [Ruminococcus callidus ATCC 27760]|uniref:Uncharacterized protein n=1 Tax=Ruminococcus callidus ATCC 27760 TaxID=411473 RepID=U2MBE7_9FIRM|nr:hypothetical protein RUMCAL_01025 [Ruminococcus callidus ATCC 27760]
MHEAHLTALCNFFSFAKFQSGKAIWLHCLFFLKFDKLRNPLYNII